MEPKSNSCNSPIIYLSISRQASEKIVKSLMKHLNSYKCDVKYQVAGEYNEDLIVGCDYFIIVPPDISDHTKVGKGQYTEIKTALTYTSNVFVLFEYEIDEDENNKEYFSIDLIYDIDGYNRNDWKFEYGAISTYDTDNSKCTYGVIEDIIPLRKKEVNVSDKIVVPNFKETNKTNNNNLLLLCYYK